MQCEYIWENVLKVVKLFVYLCSFLPLTSCNIGNLFSIFFLCPSAWRCHWGIDTLKLTFKFLEWHLKILSHIEKKALFGTCCYLLGQFFWGCFGIEIVSEKNPQNFGVALTRIGLILTTFSSLEWYLFLALCLKNFVIHILLEMELIE